MSEKKSSGTCGQCRFGKETGEELRCVNFPEEAENAHVRAGLKPAPTAEADAG